MREHLQKELLDTPEELGNLGISTNSSCPRGGVSDGTLASLSPTSDCLLPSSQAPAKVAPYDFWTPNSLSQQNQRLTWFKAFTLRALHTYAKQYVWPAEPQSWIDWTCPGSAPSRMDSQIKVCSHICQKPLQSQKETPHMHRDCKGSPSRVVNPSPP